MKNSPNTFGQIIYEARKKKRYTMVELARLIIKEDGKPIKQQYLSDLENNRRTHPSDRIIQELAKVLEIPVAELYVMAKRLPPSFDTNNVAAVKAISKKIEEYAAA